MNATAKKLLTELSQLPVEERDEIVTRLYEEESNIDLRPEWNEEIRRRIEDHESGRTRAISFDEAMKMIRAEGEGNALA